VFDIKYFPLIPAIIALVWLVVIAFEWARRKREELKNE